VLQQAAAIPSAAFGKPVNAPMASGTNTDSHGYVTNAALLTPFTLTNAAGEAISNVVLVRLMPNKFIYKRPDGNGGMMRLDSLPADLLQKIGYDAQAAQAADEAEKAKQAQAQELARQQRTLAVQPSPFMAQGPLAASDVLRAIRAKAEGQWPADYEMQKYEVDKQTEAYNWVFTTTSVTGVPQGVFDQIKTGAVNEWPDDYEMQKYEIEKQVKAYIELH
jgi:hypothetical protein